MSLHLFRYEDQTILVRIIKGHGQLVLQTISLFTSVNVIRVPKARISGISVRRNRREKKILNFIIITRLKKVWKQEYFDTVV